MDIKLKTKLCELCEEGTARKKYCSSVCVKRAYELRKHPKRSSYFSKKTRHTFWNTETGKGFFWENYVAQKIGAKHLQFNKFGADLDWGGKSVDVKSSNVWKRKRKRGIAVKSEHSGVWVFNRNKEKVIDYFYCVCIEAGKPIKELFIPASEFPKTGIVMGRKSKYDKYQVC